MNLFKEFLSKIKGKEDKKFLVTEQVVQMIFIIILGIMLIKVFDGSVAAIMFGIAILINFIICLVQLIKNLKIKEE